MRPPSYYTSLANSNSYNRNSSQQLRSTFSSTGSSSYVSRTHLPFVAQSTLVAHCLTGAGSSTKPYSSSGGLTTAPSYSHTRYASSYTRPQSTNQRHTTSINTSASSYLSSSLYSPSYLSSTSSTSSTSRSSYRPSSSSYYKPIRLRERPLLTQLSRQIQPPSSNQQATTSSRVHSARLIVEEGSTQNGQSEPKPAALQSEESWSSDVARNISRNKYLIKFREIDKRPSIVPQPVESPPVQPAELVAEKPEVVVKKIEEPVMKLPPPKLEPFEKSPLIAPKSAIKEPVKAEQSPIVLTPVKCDTKEPEVIVEKKAPVKEKRNIKLKIKTRNVTSAEGETTEKPKSKLIKKSSPKVQDGDQSPVLPADSAPTTNGKSGKAKRVIKGTKTSQTKATASAEEENLTKATAEPTSKGKTVEAKSTKEPRKVLALKQVESNARQPIRDVETPDVEPAKTEVSKTLVESPATAAANKRIRFREYHIDDFNFLSVLGHGGWGFVILAELKEHDACFAVKCIKKITIVEDDDFDSIMIERKVLALGNVHPFICKLFCTFETPGYLFFVMEYCAGGDLMFHVQREGKFTESRCRFYAAEIICAIRFLHNRHIIYRDLKLDNILLDSSGHIRLVDFGMCQCRTYREEMLPSNFCGTPEYISPEIIKGVPYNHSVDWWSFGVLLYEMAVGKMPFRGNDENELLWNVCYEQIHYPMFLSRELSTLLQTLLEREPTKRMGMATCKAGDIYDQAWFRGVDWQAVEELRVKPPFVPEVTSKRDVQNFDADFTESAPELSPVDEATLSRIDQRPPDQELQSSGTCSVAYKWSPAQMGRTIEGDRIQINICAQFDRI